MSSKNKQKKLFMFIKITSCIYGLVCNGGSNGSGATFATP